MSNKDLENLINFKGSSNKKSKRKNTWISCIGCNKKFNGEHRLDWHLEITTEDYIKLDCYKNYSHIAESN